MTWGAIAHLRFSVGRVAGLFCAPGTPIWRVRACLLCCCTGCVLWWGVVAVVFCVLWQLLCPVLLLCPATDRVRCLHSLLCAVLPVADGICCALVLLMLYSWYILR